MNLFFVTGTQPGNNEGNYKSQKLDLDTKLLLAFTMGLTQYFHDNKIAIDIKHIKDLANVLLGNVSAMHGWSRKNNKQKKS